MEAAGVDIDAFEVGINIIGSFDEAVGKSAGVLEVPDELDEVESLFVTFKVLFYLES
jgi:hypothetical protein